MGIAAVWSAVVGVAPLRAQVTWNDPRTRATVERARVYRETQATRGPRDYRAVARGYLTFLGQLGEGFTAPPRVVRIDQLAVEVWWRAPDLSRQRLIGRRDTLLLPADIGYYRDRFGIVQHNLRDRIRLGDGQDVRDVPHPLSPAGAALYDFAVRDSLVLRSPQRTLYLDAVAVRPVHDTLAAAVGTIFLDRETGAVARMALTFTDRALLDRRIETLSLVLENALIGDVWLPSHQELEVVRRPRWIEFPARGIIRARWDLCCYELDVGLDPAAFPRTEFTRASPSALAAFPFAGAITDSLPPDVRLASDRDVREVLATAQRLMGSRGVGGRPPAGGLAVPAISDLVRVNRVEGVGLGLGGTVRLGPVAAARVQLRYGTADHAFKGRVALRFAPRTSLTWHLFAERKHPDLGESPEVSTLRNSIAAGVFGEDWTSPYRVEAVGADVSATTQSGGWSIRAAYEAHDQLTVNASPLSGRFRPVAPARPLRVGRVEAQLRAGRGAGPGPAWETHLRLGMATWAARDPGSPGGTWARGSAAATVVHQMGTTRLASRSTAAGVLAGATIPRQALVHLGGPRSAPGYAPHSLFGSAAVTQRIAWELPVPFFALRLGRWGRTPPRATLVPFAQITVTHGGRATAPGRRGVFPSLGLDARLIFDLLHLQIARGLRPGRWFLSIDIAPMLWSIS